MPRAGDRGIIPKRTPQLLSTFPIEFHEITKVAYKEKSFAIEFASPTEALRKKFEFYRFWRSLNYYQESSELARMGNLLKIRTKDHILELVRKDEEPAVGSMREALNEYQFGLDKIKKKTSTDKVGDSVRALDDEFAELRKMVEEGKLPPPGTPQED